MALNDHLEHKKPCLVCKKVFTTRLYSQKYCSNDCALKIERERRSSIHNYNIFSIFQRDGFRCHYCGKSPHKKENIELTVDHIIPLSRGGQDIEENIITACRECNTLKGTKILSEELIDFLKNRE